MTHDSDTTFASADPLRGTKSLLHLRMVELCVFAAIVFVAKEIAHLTFQTGTILTLLAVAGVLQLIGPPAWKFLKRKADLGPSHDVLLSWYSSLVDLMSVLGIIYFTGTVESPFLFLLVVPLLFASHTFSWKLTIGVFMPSAVVSTGILGYLELEQIISHFSPYTNRTDVYLNKHYYIGSLLVLASFLSLILFLSHAFHTRLRHSMEKLRRQDRETTDKIHQLTRLYDISLGINAVMTVETLLKMVAKEATILLGQPWASIILFNQQQEITHQAMVGIPEHFRSTLGSRMRKGGLTEWLWKNNKPISVDDVLGDKRASTGEFLMATKIRSLIGFPLSNGQHVIGVIYVGDFVKKRFEEKHVRLLSIMCDQLAIAIAKSKLYESLQRKIADYETRLETLDKVNHLKSEYVSHVSHELRTPLTSIKAYIETLQLHIDDPGFTERNNFLGIVSKETERLIRIVHEILDVSSIEFGQRPLQRSTFSIEEVVDEVTYALQPKLNTKNMQIRVELPDNLPKVNADRDLMMQVFINLITNAVKYSTDGTTITVRAREEAVNLAVSIEDEGIGIPEAQVEKIFEKYFRVKSEQSRHYDGVGLGLAIVKNIIGQHGGEIKVSSAEHIGSNFTFTIPKEHCANDLLGYIAQGVDAKGELHEMLTLIVRMIAELLSAKIVSLMLLDQSRSELFIKVSYGLDEWIVDQARVKVGEGIAGKVAETGLPLLIDNIEENEVYMSPNNPQYETVSLLSMPLSVNDTIVGVINVNNKTSGQPFDEDDMNLLTSFAERISKSLGQLRSTSDAQLSLRETVEAFKKMLDRQGQTNRIEKIIEHAVKLSRKLGLSEKEVKVIQYVASVHDIGMTKVSDEILNKTFHLTPEEIEEIRQHPHHGAELIRPLEFVELVSNIILHHHERIDGLGYPIGLKGDEIPIGARILAIIDSFQSMTNEKPYREALPPFEAAKELVECAGRQFDSVAVEAFVAVLADDGKLSSQQAKQLKAMLRGAVHSNPS